jgi:two-component system catabolic regulation response regulator CreB
MTRPKIMIVEDEPAIADNIRYSLNTDGFETICFNSGSHVIKHLAREPVDLIILDIGLPDINGFELCKEIRKNYLIPIIFLTARTDEVDRVVGLEIGGDDYMTKPFSPRELSARVKAVLRRMRQGTEAAPAGRAFQIDESRKQISFFGTKLGLSRYEYALLRVFIRRPGHVFSREQLMDMVWDEPEASMDRTVDAHIKNIRIKLKAVKPELEPIITHRGMGYSFSEDL